MATKSNKSIANSRTANSAVKAKGIPKLTKSSNNSSLSPISAKNKADRKTYIAKVFGAEGVATSVSAKTKPISGMSTTVDNFKSGVKATILPTIQQITPVITDPDNTYKWNLPPHAWSLPVSPSTVTPDAVKTVADENELHSSRRGRIFLARKNTGANTAITASGKNKGKPEPAKNLFEDNYGFQFMWNPETFNQNTSVNWGITPNQNDATSGLTGLVASNSSISFTLRLDRTNDFACFNSLFFPNGKNLMSIEAAMKFYTKGQPANSKQDFSNNMDSKIIDLFRRGTEADLEYLYRTINGAGYSQFGVETSNISYLMPTIIRLDLGPKRVVGMIQGVNVTHLAFTKEMIPIRTDVSISIDLKANTQFSTSNTTGGNVPSIGGSTP